MTFFRYTIKNQLGMVAGTRKGRGACNRALRQPCPFIFERGERKCLHEKTPRDTHKSRWTN